MAIHHDSHAYGNLEKLRADISEDALLSDLAALNEETKKEENPDKNEKSEHKNNR